jgi:IS605 OrfB family transposase
MMLRATSLTEQIKTLQKTVDKWKGAKGKLHGKKRRLAHLQNKLKQLKGDIENGTIRLCFGGKKLFRSQFHLQENGYSSHQEWKLDFDRERKSEFFIMGSKEETAGNQTCSAIINDDDSITLRLRLPDALIKEKKYTLIPNVRFKYGQEAVLSSIRSCLERKTAKDNTLGSAITYRLKKDRKGWTIFATTALKQPKKITKDGIGVFGIDINANHLAFAETDRFGNIINKGTIPLNTYGKTKDQALAIIGDASTKVVSLAKDKPIVLEKLDFQKKKTSLREEFNKKLSRMLSSFSYQKIVSMIRSRAWRLGVSCHLVNPAFTSVIGLVKFAHRYGLSKHHAAAFCIARRYFWFF